MSYISPVDCHDNRRCVNYAGKHHDERYGFELYLSLAICHDVEWACVTNNEHGVGVFSWHHFKDHAEHNALMTGGRAVPVDRYKGELLLPPLAKAVVDRFLNEG